MSSESIKTGFFTALAGTCRGTDIFLQLRHQSLIRALWHMFILLVICSTAIVAVQNITDNRKLDDVANSFRAMFGGVELDRDGKMIVPLARPGESRSMLLPNGGLIVYVPAGREIPALPESTSVNDFRYLIYWFPYSFVLGTRLQEDEINVMTFRPGNISDGLGQARTVDAKGFGTVLKNAEKFNGSITLPPGDRTVIQGDVLVSLLRVWGSVISFIMFAFGGFIQILFYILVFTVMFNITGARRLQKIRFKELLVCAVYAGFPAVMVGSAFPAFDLPLLTFGSAYVTGMIIFLLTVIGRIENTGDSAAGEEKKDDSKQQ